MKQNGKNNKQRSGTGTRKLPPLKHSHRPIGKNLSEPKKQNAAVTHTPELKKPIPPANKTPSPPKRRRRWVLISYGLFVVIMGSIAGLVVGLINDSLDQLPTIEYLEDYRPFMPSRMFAGNNNRLIAEFFNPRQNRQMVRLSDISPYLSQAVLTMEDNEFYTHPGISVRGIARAAYADIKNWNRRQGGSTITIQLAEDLIKNGYLKDSNYNLPEMNLKSFTQKFWEAVLALKIEKRYTKEEILEFYLNQVFMGGITYGVARAAEFYFGKSASELTLKEAALFAAMLPAPNAYSPISHPKNAQRRTELVLREMRRRDLITVEQYRQAVDEPFRLNTKAARRKQLALYPYFSNVVLRKFKSDKIKTNRGQPIKIYGQGVDIHSTLDEDLQRAAETALRQGIVDHERVRRTHGRNWGNPGYNGLNSSNPSRLIVDKLYDASILSDYDPEKGTIQVTVRNVRGGEGPFTVPVIPGDVWFDEFDVLKKSYVVRVKAIQKGGKIELRLVPDKYVQGAIVVAQPSTGKILAMAGGYDFGDKKNSGEFIRAIQATTVQPGSAFKPMLFSAVLSDPNKQWTLTSILQDEEIDYGNDWIPQNFEGQYFGSVTIHHTLTHSLNAASVWMLDNFRESRSAGIKNLRSFCRNIFDLNIKEPNLTIALGSSGVTPLDLAQAYAVIANGGNFMKLHLVDRVYPRTGTRRNEPNPIYQFKQPYAGAQRMTPQTAYLVTCLMRNVIEEGTGKDALDLPFYCVGKTGTTDNCAYAWFAGYAKDLLCVVYLGYDEFNRSLGYKRTGSKVALPVWMNMLQKAHEFHPELFGDIVPPPGIVFQETCLESGFVASPDCPETKSIPFIEGTETDGECPVHGKDSLRPYQSEANRFILNLKADSIF